MTRPTRKEREWRHFSLLREQCNLIPQGIACLGERPDITVKHEGAIVGVELTELFRPTPLERRPPQEQEALRREIVERARRALIGTPYKDLHAQVLFAARTHFRKTDIGPLADAVAHLVAAADVPPEQRVRLDPRTPGKSVLNAVTSIHV